MGRFDFLVYDVAFIYLKIKGFDYSTFSSNKMLKPYVFLFALPALGEKFLDTSKKFKEVCDGRSNNQI